MYCAIGNGLKKMTSRVVGGLRLRPREILGWGWKKRGKDLAAPPLCDSSSTLLLVDRRRELAESVSC